jgi:hypothetical protein
MFQSNVQPRRRVAAIRKADWECPDCKRENKYYWKSCSCGAKRPK